MRGILAQGFEEFICQSYRAAPPVLGSDQRRQLLHAFLAGALVSCDSNQTELMLELLAIREALEASIGPVN